MRQLEGKTAFITGGAGGIGLAMAQAFGREGMAVMIADVDTAALATALDDLRVQQIRAEGIVCDVESRASVQAAAKAAVEAFGKVHLVCNNAGVAAGGPLGAVAEKDWDWVVDVNLKGVVYGVETFTPLLLSHGEGGHFVNTASMAGLLSGPGMEPYSATKFAVVALSEGWAAQLAPQGVGMSILCPAYVRTRIHESGRNRQAAYGPATAPPQDAPPSPVLSGIPVAPVARRVVEAVLEDQLYIFTHPEFRDAVIGRHQRIMHGFDAADASAALAALPPRPAPVGRT